MFSDKGIPWVLSTTDEANAFWRAFLQEVMNQGGDIADLNGILKDAKSNDRFRLAEIARIVVGRMWELARTPVDLDDVDFTTPLAELYPRAQLDAMFKYYASISKDVIDPGDKLKWIGSSPRGKCKYILSPLREVQSREGLMSAVNYEDCAGVRELICYMQMVRLMHWDMRWRRIFALGSQLRKKNGRTLDDGKLVLPALMKYCENCTEVQRVLHDDIHRVGGNADFYLKRVYE